MVSYRLLEFAGPRYGCRDAVAEFSNVDETYLRRVVLNELPTRLDLISHQNGENLFGFHRVLQADFQHRSGFGVHRCGPELLRVHLAQPFISLDADPLLPRFLYRFEDIEEKHNLYLQRPDVVRRLTRLLEEYKERGYSLSH